MKWIDSHTHLYLPDFKEDIDGIIANAKRNEVEQVYLPAIDSETHEDLLNLVQKDARFFRPMMGVHPCSVKEHYKEELTIAENYLNSRNNWSAVGEIGLDFYWDVSFREQQIEAFHIQIEWAIAKNLPIVIHSRKSTYECIEIVKQYKGKLRGIFHCFSGSLEEANEIVKLDFLLGIGGVVTYKNAGLKQVIPKIDLKHIVLETDSPYLTPVPYRGKRNESAYIRLVADEIALLTNKPLLEIADITTQNALTLFK